MIRRLFTALFELWLLPLRLLDHRHDPEIEIILRDAMQSMKEARAMRALFIANGVPSEQITKMDEIEQQWVKFANQYRHLSERYARDG